MSRPEIVVKEINGVRMEPVEDLAIDVAEDYQGVVISGCGTRRGIMTNLVNHGSGRVKMEFRRKLGGVVISIGNRRGATVSAVWTSSAALSMSRARSNWITIDDAARAMTSRSAR